MPPPPPSGFHDIPSRKNRNTIPSRVSRWVCFESPLTTIDPSNEIDKGDLFVGISPPPTSLACSVYVSTPADADADADTDADTDTPQVPLGLS